MSAAGVYVIHERDAPELVDGVEEAAVLERHRLDGAARDGAADGDALELRHDRGHEAVF